MAFVFQGSLFNGGTEPRVSNEPVVSATIVNGAIVAKALGAATVSIKANTTTQAIWGICKGTIASTDTVCQVENLPTGALVMADVYEIAKKTDLSLASGSATTAVITALVAGNDSMLIGSQWQVIAKAADSTQVGNTLTITAYTSSSGTLTFATTTSLFATGDKLRCINLGIPSTKLFTDALGSSGTSAFNIPFVSNPYLVGTYKWALDSTGAYVVLAQTAAGTMNFFKCLGTDDTGKKVLLVVLNGMDATAVLATT